MDAQHAIEYDDRSAQAVYKVLIEIGQVLGAYRDRIVVIGGSVPWLLLPDARPRHIGTIDVDISLDAEALGGGDYANLVELLEAAGYARAHGEMRVFQMRRSVPMDDGEPVVVMVDLLMPREARFARNKPPLLAGFAVLKADGAGIAMKNYVVHQLRGEMPDGRSNSVELRVATIPAFLVMKGHALCGRDKPKDAYDIYFSIRQYRDGADALADACRPLLSDNVAIQAFKNIASKFESPRDYGPETIARFLEQSFATDGMTADQIKADAFGQVRALLKALGI